MADPKPPIIWSPEAIADLDEIWSYYARAASVSTADKIIRAIEQACRLLQDHPFAGRAREEIRPGLRSVIAQPHVAFYRVNHDLAEIVRVIDGRQDIDELFLLELKDTSQL
jgi:toxin ParE1/3/4